MKIKRFAKRPKGHAGIPKAPFYKFSYTYPGKNQKLKKAREKKVMSLTSPKMKKCVFLVSHGNLSAKGLLVLISALIWFQRLRKRKNNFSDMKKIEKILQK